MSLKQLFYLFAIVLLPTVFVGCSNDDDDEPLLPDQQAEETDSVKPIKASAMFMVGDATPAGWDIANPEPLKRSVDDPLLFRWEGQLQQGEMKLCFLTGSWDIPFVRPLVDGTEIGRSDIVDAGFAMHAGDPDEKWKVTEAGKYLLTFNLHNRTMSTRYLGEPDPIVLPPVEADNVYIVGDASPVGWNINSPKLITKVSRYIFVYEGQLFAGELKACIQTGDWNVPFIRPAFADCKINKNGVEDPAFVFTNDPDDKWKVEEAGRYRLTFDLEHYTIQVECLP